MMCGHFSVLYLEFPRWNSPPAWVGVGAAALGSSGQLFAHPQTLPSAGEVQTFPVPAVGALGQWEKGTCRVNN